MKMRFKTEKQAREETIGRALTMAKAALGAKRELSQREAAKIDALLAVAESLGLGTNIPREAGELVAWAGRPQKSAITMAGVLAHDPDLKKPSKGKKGDK